MIEARIQPTFDDWRTRARTLVAANIAPEEVIWTHDTDAPLLPGWRNCTSIDAAETSAPHNTAYVPPAFLSIAAQVAMHRDSSRWGLLYRILHRLSHGERHLLEISIDPDVHHLLAMAARVRRDLHKMHAFVRFRRVAREGVAHYIAFHRPDHLILPAAAPWFARRFAIMQWTIFTPDASATWNARTLNFGHGAGSSGIEDDGLEELWRTYYANIFNPARVKVRAMKKEMPVRHWATLPETGIIKQLLREAPGRVEQMMKATPNRKSPAPMPAADAAAFIPQSHSLKVLAEAIQKCRGCDLYCNATQAIFGEGPADAVTMLVGEQPGDNEDLAGRPFVGPAGQLLDACLDEAGIDRSLCYVTNAVKHFKFEQRGPRRIHAKPNAREISACRPWLRAETDRIEPWIIIALGATAAQSMMGPQFRVTKSHGQVFAGTPWGPGFVATIHPSALLRIPDPARREGAREMFVADLKIAAKQIERSAR